MDLLIISALHFLVMVMTGHDIKGTASATKNTEGYCNEATYASATSISSSKQTLYGFITIMCPSCNLSVKAPISTENKLPEATSFETQATETPISSLQSTQAPIATSNTMLDATLVETQATDISISSSQSTGINCRTPISTASTVPDATLFETQATNTSTSSIQSTPAPISTENTMPDGTLFETQATYTSTTSIQCTPAPISTSSTVPDATLFETQATYTSTTSIQSTPVPISTENTMPDGTLFETQATYTSTTSIQCIPALISTTSTVPDATLFETQATYTSTSAVKNTQAPISTASTVPDATLFVTQATYTSTTSTQSTPPLLPTTTTWSSTTIQTTLPTRPSDTMRPSSPSMQPLLPTTTNWSSMTLLTTLPTRPTDNTRSSSPSVQAPMSTTATWRSTRFLPILPTWPSDITRSSSPSTQPPSRTTLPPAIVEGQLQNISQVILTPDNVQDNAEKVIAAISSAGSLTKSAIADSASIVTNMANLLAGGNITEALYPVPSLIGKIVGNLMNSNEGDFPVSQTNGKTSVQRSLETSLLALTLAASGDSISINESYLSLQEPNVAFQIVIDPAVIGISISGASSLSEATLQTLKNNSSTSSKGGTTVNLSPTVAKIPKTFIIYNNAKLFQTTDSVQADQDGRVVSVQLVHSLNLSVPGLITLVFDSTTEPPRSMARTCGYWDYVNNSWSSAGCSSTIGSDNAITCACDHLTNFAALLAPCEGDLCKVLDLLTTVGLAISVFGLLAVTISFLAFRKMRRTQSQKVLFNLSLSLLLLNSIFLGGIDRIETRIGCIIVAILLHYFLLTSFMWMLMESILQYLRFVKVIGTYIPRFMVKTSIPAWGIPAIIVTIIAGGIDVNLYDRGGAVHSYCFAKQEVIYYAVLPPIGLILIINLVMFSIIIKAFCCRKRRFAYQSSRSERSLALLHAQAGMFIFVLLGLTWIVGFFAFLPDATARTIFQWMFCICNTLQGLFIFVFQCVREKDLGKEWRAECCGGQTSSRLLSTSEESSSTMSRSTSTTRIELSFTSLQSSRSYNLRPLSKNPTRHRR